MCLSQIIIHLAHLGTLRRFGLAFGLYFRSMVGFAFLSAAALGFTLTQFSPLHLLWVLPVSFIACLVFAILTEVRPRPDERDPVPDVADWPDKREFIRSRRMWRVWGFLWYGSMALFCAGLAYLIATWDRGSSVWMRLLPGLGVSLLLSALFVPVILRACGLYCRVCHTRFKSRGSRKFVLATGRCSACHAEMIRDLRMRPRPRPSRSESGTRLDKVRDQVEPPLGSI